MTLGGAIKPAECLIRTAGRNVEIIMFKEEVGPFWPFLDKAKTKGNKIKADWSKWVDEDEEDEKPDFDMSGFGGMGGGMGGMGGMDFSKMGKQRLRLRSCVAAFAAWEGCV